MTERLVHISVGAGFENDRRDMGPMAAEALSCVNGPRYLIFEGLAERTLALNVLSKDSNELAEHAVSFIAPCIKLCVEHGIKIVTNMGGPDPTAVAAGIKRYLSQCDLTLNVAAVTGDAIPVMVSDGQAVLAKNAYTGAFGIVEALSMGADIVIAGRVADPSLVVGPVAYELGLDKEDWDALANATLAGHLIECGTQVCGGYYADQGSPVPGLEALGPPLVSVGRRDIEMRKPVGGGILNTATVTQQLLYEIHNPARYLTPDVILDLTDVEINELASNKISLHGAKGHPRPPTLKTLLCRQTGWFAEGEISYSGSTAAYRAAIAMELLEHRLYSQSMLITCHSGDIDGITEERVRIAVRAPLREKAIHALNELDALYLNGPAAGGGVRKALFPMVETEPGLVNQEQIQQKVTQISE